MFPDISGAVSSIVSKVPTPGKFTLIPMQYTSKIPTPVGFPYTIPFNPENFTFERGMEFDSCQAPGSQGSMQRFINVRPGTFSLDFIVDGTGASGDKQEVDVEVARLRLLAAVNSDIHRPLFIIAVWGTFFSVCVITNLKVDYTLFRKNGTPLRAKVSMSFADHTPPLLGLLEMNLQSPDLTHFHQVVEGDTLPLICNREYKDPRFYIQVAMVNGKTSPRMINKGERLRFPPLKRNTDA